MEDNLNRRNGKDIVGWGSSIIERDWRPRQNKLSNLKATNIDNIPTVSAY